MSKKLVANYTTSELKELVGDNTSCVTVHKSVYNLQLFPYHLSDTGASIKEILNAKVARYDKVLDGILLGYKNLKLLTPQGSIICDSCYIHIVIEADFYIFKPEIDSLLTGIVNKKSDNHFGCLVHRLFNVSVPNTDDENWAGKYINIGDEVILRVVFLDIEARLPYIRAEWVETKTKAKVVIKKEPKDNSTDVQSQDEIQTKKKKKRDKEDIKPILIKKKKIKQEPSDEESVTNNNGSYTDLNFDESLNKKKKRMQELLNQIKELSNIQDSENSQSKTKNKKKSTEIKNELNNSKSKKEKLKINGHVDSKSEVIKSLQNSEIIHQNGNFNKSPEGKKKRKSTNHESDKEPVKVNIHANPSIMADAEDRKTKRRKSSISQNIDWENKELDLYDSDLEKTLGKFSPSESKESMNFNLVKIAALNESNLLKRENNSEEEFVDVKEKKRKRKSNDKDANDGVPKPKKMKKETKETKSEAVVKKKSKTKKT